MRTVTFLSVDPARCGFLASPPPCLVAVGNGTFLPPLPSSRPRPHRFSLPGTMSWDPVNTLCEQLVKAVTAMMDPASTQRYRLEALKVSWRGRERPFEHAHNEPARSKRRGGGWDGSAWPPPTFPACLLLFFVWSSFRDGRTRKLSLPLRLY